MSPRGQAAGEAAAGYAFAMAMPPDFRWTVAHRRRLRQVWGSAGWPCQDMIELDLVAAGLLERVSEPDGRERVRLSERGVQTLAAARRGHQGARDAHEALVERVAREMHRAGRIAWCGLSLRAPLDGRPASAPIDSPAAAGKEGESESDGGALWPGQDAAADGDGPSPSPVRWVMAMPDVYSIRHTTREDAVEPIAHEIKVRRADLLSDLRRPDKARAYLALSSQCWYVVRAGLATLDEIPEPYGVLWAHADGGLELARAAARRPMKLPLAIWMALARARPWAGEDEDPQCSLGDEGLSGPQA